MVFLLSSALALGFVHGLSADHLMAIAALTASANESAARRTFGVALRFAAGHALLLAAGASAVLMLGWTIPVLVERVGEVAGAAALVVLGIAGLWVALTRRVYAHAHPHGHTRSQWHLHFGRPERHPRPLGHSHVPALVGAVFAVSGLRALTLMLPFSAHSASVLLPLVLVFGVGILASMTLFGVLLSRVLGTPAVARVGRAAGAATSLASIALGVYWTIS